MSFHVGYSPYRSSLSSSTTNRRRRSSQSFRLPSFQVPNVAALKLKFDTKTLILGMVGVAILMTVSALVHTNQSATKGYDLRRLEADRQTLMNKTDIQNTQLAQVQSMRTIMNSDVVGKMRRPSAVEFVHGNTALASR